MPGQEVPLLKVLGVGGVVGVGLAAVPHGLRIGSSLRRERRDHFGLELPGVIPQERRKSLDPVGIPPPLPRTLIVLRQLPHDLDRPRVLREHHLALRAVDVVARVDLLRTLGRRCRRGPCAVVDCWERAAVALAAVAGACEGAAAALLAAAVGGGAPNCSSRMSCIAVCVESVGSRNVSAPADCIIPLTR